MTSIKYKDPFTGEVIFYRVFTDELVGDNPRRVNNELAKMISTIRKHIINTYPH